MALIKSKWLVIFNLLSIIILFTTSLGDTDEPTVIHLRYESEASGESYSQEADSKKVGNHTITIQGDDFILDGQPLQIISGSIHYFRIPAAYWRDRLRKMKAGGLNTIATCISDCSTDMEYTSLFISGFYVEWNFHEPEERQYNFEGDRNVVEFIQIAAEEGLHVILRVGPYICAERDMGGLPYWLLGKYPDIKLRTTDKDYIKETIIWVDKLFEYVKPLLFGNGGPIILVQVENEYGSYSSDMPYKIKTRDIIMKHVGTNALLYTTDGYSSKYISGGYIPGTLTTVDFGPTTRKAAEVFSELRRFMPHGPLMNSEFYTGWLTHWKSPFARTSKEAITRTLKDILENKINVNFYMFCGGTNFEFMGGANYEGTYITDITSYDYDAPLSEAGDPTDKFYAIRDVIKEFKKEDLDVVPPPSKKGKYGTVSVAPRINLLSAEGRQQLGKQYQDVSGSKLPTFELLRQRSGLVLYETTLDGSEGLLVIKKPRDMIFVFVDREFKGTISRMSKMLSLPLTSKNNSVLSLLVENQGRINYGPYLRDDKGILGEVTYNKKALNGNWKITGYPLERVESPSNIDTVETKIPTLFEGRFTIPAGEEPLDTFLDTTEWGKGYIWINGYNLGRYWPQVGPQITLYVPGVWLKSGPEGNLVQVLELLQPSDNLTVNFIDHPILDRLKK